MSKKERAAGNGTSAATKNNDNYPDFILHQNAEKVKSASYNPYTRALEKLGRIIAREGTLDGQRLTEEYFSQLLDEEFMAIEFEKATFGGVLH